MSSGNGLKFYLVSFRSDDENLFDSKTVSRKKTDYKSDILSGSDELSEDKERDDHIEGVLQRNDAGKIQDSTDTRKVPKQKHKKTRKEHRERDKKGEHKDRDSGRGHSDRDRKGGYRDRDAKRGHVSSDSSLLEDCSSRPKKKKKHKSKHKKSKSEKSSLRSELEMQSTARYV